MPLMFGLAVPMGLSATLMMQSAAGLSSSLTRSPRRVQGSDGSGSAAGSERAVLMPRAVAGRSALVSLQRSAQHNSQGRGPPELGHRASPARVTFLDSPGRTHR